MGIRVRGIHNGTTRSFSLGRDGKLRTEQGEIVNQSDIKRDTGGGCVAMMGSFIFLGVLAYFLFV